MHFRGLLQNVLRLVQHSARTTVVTSARILAARAIYKQPYVTEQKRQQLLDRARQLRAPPRMKVGKVDLNRLLDEIKDGGIVAVYRCPHCKGKLKLGKDASVESLKIWKYCGSEIETMELADFLRTALS